MLEYGFENEEEIAMMLAKHFEQNGNKKSFDFSKISVENKEELMKVLRKRSRRVKDDKRRPDIKALAPNGRPVAAPRTTGVVTSRRGRPKQQLPANLPPVQVPAPQPNSHTKMLNTDLLTLGSVVPGCDPRVEPPGLVMSKARWHILRLEDLLRKAISERQLTTRPKPKKCSLDRIVN